MGIAKDLVEVTSYMAGVLGQKLFRQRHENRINHVLSVGIVAGYFNIFSNSNIIFQDLKFRIFLLILRGGFGIFCFWEVNIMMEETFLGTLIKHYNL